MDQITINEELASIKKKLHRQSKLLRWSLTGWIAIFSFLALGVAYKNSAFFDEIKVKRLALIDAQGVERMILVADSDTVRVNGKVYPRRPLVSGIIVQNPQGDEVGGFVSSDNGMAVMMLDSYSKHSQYGASERVGMVAMPDGMAGLLLTDLSGKMRSCIYTDETLATGFIFKDQQGSVRMAGHVKADGTTTWETKGTPSIPIPSICSQ